MTGWTIPVLGCRICDRDRSWDEIPDEPCGHDFDQRMTIEVPVVPAAAVVDWLRSRGSDMDYEVEKFVEDFALTPALLTKEAS